jgi:hypothetical protein
VYVLSRPELQPQCFGFSTLPFTFAVVLSTLVAEFVKVLRFGFLKLDLCFFDGFCLSHASPPYSLAFQLPDATDHIFRGAWLPHAGLRFSSLDAWISRAGCIASHRSSYFFLGFLLFICFCFFFFMLLGLLFPFRGDSCILICVGTSLSRCPIFRLQPCFYKVGVNFHSTPILFYLFSFDPFINNFQFTWFK